MSEDRERDDRVEELLPLARRLARRLKRLVPHFDLDDLMSDGCVGLLRAVDSFDPNRGTKLEEYARRLIVGAMLNGVRRMDPVSERARRIVRDGENERYAIAAQRGDLPSTNEMERRRPGYRRAVAAAYRGQPLSLDAPLPIGESLAGDWRDDPARIVERRGERRYLDALIDGLHPRQRQIVLLHYFNETSLRTVSKRLAISPQRASQLHLSAIAHLKRLAASAPR
ncbi:MAG: sigma-70 family RNA polymerase sigma factor [Candidatus Eremiobacteraeota bacterium]|nr:sigma-70 family RNA polymerase sigma factor [Candidatus Eremiobacteraeota bacterium]MBV9262896.1 sigma-70 family RNA polymerase sigma factor [Candidatus Eremiobacteraeota bacterium]